MQYITFTLDGGEGVWKYKDIEISESTDHSWILNIESTLRVYSTIYDLLDILFKEGMCATFRLPEEAENIPSKCG